MLQRRILFLLIPLMLAISYAMAADSPSETVEQRLRALEAKVIDLERRLEVSESSRTMPASVEPASAAAPAAESAPARAMPPPLPATRSGAAAAQTIASPPSQAPAQWHALKRGMSWSQVIELLGKPGKKRVSPMAETWYYPDSDGGTIEFDRDGRVSGWSEP